MCKTLFSLLVSLCFFATSFAQTSTFNYTASTDDFPNPERGFYLYSATKASNYTLLDASTLASYRDLHTPATDANYDIYSTLVFRYFILDDFVNDPISASFLANMQLDFDAARTAGVKLIPRFTYTTSYSGDGCASWICPPYGDASKPQMLEHIGQVKNVLQANKDVIAVVQMGFIGVWGENYYTDHFGDASQSPFILNNTNWQDRNDILDSLLKVVPTDRMVQARYPQLKQRLVYGISAPTTAAALTAAEAYQNTHKARIGFHNDCFLASYTDFGTYNDYGPPSSMEDTLRLKPYKAADSKYVVVGGETCALNTPDSDCAVDGGIADKALARFHYSYLNAQYNNDVNNKWVGSCMENIKQRLGYRLVLQTGTYTNAAQAGQTINIDINLSNEGYAAPYNPRGVELVLQHTNSQQLYYAPLDVDPRFWCTGDHTISETLCLPENLPTGNYALFLYLPDPEPTLFDRPEYAIRLANDNIWDATTGFNALGHTLSVNTSATASTCTSEAPFTSISSYDPDYCPNMLNVQNTIATDTYYANDQIISDGSVQLPDYVIFKAGNSIDLLADFEVQLGAQFLGMIEACP